MDAFCTHLATIAGFDNVSVQMVGMLIIIILMPKEECEVNSSSFVLAFCASLIWRSNSFGGLLPGFGQSGNDRPELFVSALSATSLLSLLLLQNASHSPYIQA